MAFSYGVMELRYREISARNVSMAARNASNTSMGDLAAQFVLDMHADDLVKRTLGGKTESARAGRIEPARPAGNDPRHQRIRLAADAGGDLIAGDPAQRGDLLGHRATYARHRQIDARAELCR